MKRAKPVFCSKVETYKSWVRMEINGKVDSPNQ